MSQTTRTRMQHDRKMALAGSLCVLLLGTTRADAVDTEVVSIATDGTPGSGDSRCLEGTANIDRRPPSLSADGRLVAFESMAANLVPGDTNDKCDVFIHDRHTRVTQRVSVAVDGTPGNRPSFAPRISADGRFVTFASTGGHGTS